MKFVGVMHVYLYKILCDKNKSSQLTVLSSSHQKTVLNDADDGNISLFLPKSISRHYLTSMMASILISDSSTYSYRETDRIGIANYGLH